MARLLTSPRIVRLAAAVAVPIAAVAVVIACSRGGDTSVAGNGGGGSSGSVVKLNTAARITVTVGASGGTIASSTGDRITIPAGAVTRDTAVTMTPFSLPSDAAVVGGAQFEPDDLVFEQAATVTFQLSHRHTPGSTLLMAASLPGSSLNLYPTGAAAVVDASGMTATGQIWTFSPDAVIHNCHAFTRDYVLKEWEKAGLADRTADKLAAAANMKLEDFVGSSAVGWETPGDEVIQYVILRPYFVKCAESAPGTKFSIDDRNLIASTIADQRLVVFLFGPSLRKDEYLYRGATHSGVGLAGSGEVLIHNSFPWSAEERKQLTEAHPTLNWDAGQYAFDWSLNQIDDPTPDVRNDGVYTGLRALRNGALLPLLVPSCTRKVESDGGLGLAHVIAFCEKPRSSSGGGGGGGGGAPTACVNPVPSGNCTTAARPMDCGAGGCCDAPNTYVCKGKCTVIQEQALAECGTEECQKCDVPSRPPMDGSYTGRLTVDCDPRGPFDIDVEVVGGTITVFAQLTDSSVAFGEGTVGTFDGNADLILPFFADDGSLLAAYHLTGTFSMKNPPILLVPPYFSGSVVSPCTGSWQAVVRSGP